MFSDNFVKSVKGAGIFTLIYTVVFALAAGTISYTFPFILAFLIGPIIQPAIKFMQKKLKNGEKSTLDNIIPACLWNLFWLVDFIIF